MKISWKEILLYSLFASLILTCLVLFAIELYRKRGDEKNEDEMMMIGMENQDHPIHPVPQSHRHAHHQQLVSLADIQEATQMRDFALHMCRSLEDYPAFNPDLYNREPIESYNNCYMYAFSMENTKIHGKPQPGQLSGLPHLTKTDLTCKNIIHHVRSDFPGVLDSPDATTPCPCGYYKVNLVLGNKGPAEKWDYHWLRQDRSFWWSHKPGSTPVSVLDANNNYIANPDRANLDYSATGGVNYCTQCGYFCVPHNNPEQIFEDTDYPIRPEWQTGPPRSYHRPEIEQEPAQNTNPTNIFSLANQNSTIHFKQVN